MFLVVVFLIKKAYNSMVSPPRSMFLAVVFLIKWPNSIVSSTRPKVSNYLHEQSKELLLILLFFSRM